MQGLEHVTRGRREAVCARGTDCGMFVLIGVGGRDDTLTLDSLHFLERSNSSEAAPLLDNVELPSLPAGQKYYHHPPTEKGKLRPEVAMT